MWLLIGTIGNLRCCGRQYREG